MRNPHAADSLEGIVRWRLLSEIVHRKMDETRAALAWLTERGYLAETSGPGVEPIFSLNPEKRAEAQALLDRAEASSPAGGARCR
jgi:hypothetical protein